MGRLVAIGAALLGAAGVLVSADAAYASCAIPTAGYAGGLSGAYAVTSDGCMLLNESGGSGSTSAMATGSFSQPPSTTVYTLTSSATLATGVLTADSPLGFASASLWDTLTFSGLPSTGASIVATLSLPGILTGDSTLLAELEEGPASSFPTTGATTQSTFGNSMLALPSSISLTFTAMNGVADRIFAEILANGDRVGVANFGDPPNLDIILPRGADVIAAGGFDNFTSSVPEPPAWALLLIGFAGIGFTRSAHLVRKRAAAEL